MKNLLIALLCCLVVGSAFDSRVRAQQASSATPAAFQVSGLLANCPAAAAGAYWYCFTTTGLYQSFNGAAYSLAGGVSSSGVSSISINGSAAKTGAVTFTLTDTPTVSVSAPAVTVTAPTVTAKSSITVQ